jgi:hypothetical protein
MIIVILNDGRIQQKATIFRYVAEGVSEVGMCYSPFRIRAEAVRVPKNEEREAMRSS